MIDLSCRLRQLGAQRGVVAAVALLICANATLGILWALPALCKGWLMRMQQLIGLWLFMHVAVNFTVCVFASPGMFIQAVANVG